MIDLNKVVPGDVIKYKGSICRVLKVNLQRLQDGSTELTGITVRFLEDDKVWQCGNPIICPAGFKYIEYAPQLLNTKIIFVSGAFVDEGRVKKGKIYTIAGGRLHGIDNDGCPIPFSESFKTMKDVEEYFSDKEITPETFGSRWGHPCEVVEVVE